MKYSLRYLRYLLLPLCLAGCVRVPTSTPAAPGVEEKPAPAVAKTAVLEALAQWVDSGRCRDTDEIVGVWRELKSQGKVASELDDFANSLLSENEQVTDANRSALAARLRAAAGQGGGK